MSNNNPVDPLTGLPKLTAPTNINSLGGAGSSSNPTFTPTKEKDDEEFFNSLLSKLNQNTIVGSQGSVQDLSMQTPFKEGRFTAEGDLEQAAALAQSTAEKWRNGSLKALVTATGAAVEGIAAIPVGLTNMVYQGIKNKEVKFSDFFNTPLGQFIDEQNERMQQALPNRYTRAEQNAGVLEGAFTANFWADKVLNGTAYMAGTIASMAATGGIGTVTMGVRGAKAAFKNLKYAKATGKSNKIIDDIIEEGLKETGRVADASKAVKEFARVGRIKEGAKYADRTLTMAIAEANVEARTTIEDYYDNAVNQYMQENNLTFTNEIPEEVLKQISDNALRAANFNWALNTAIVGGTDIVGIGRYLGPKFFNNAVKQATKNRIFGKATKETVESIGGFAAKTDGVGKGVLSRAEIQSPTKFKQFTKKATSVFGVPVSETFQEGSQFISNEWATNYYAAKYSEEGTERLNDLFTSLSLAFEDALSDTEKGKEFRESLLLGFTVGGLGRGFTRVTQGSSTKNETAILENATNWLKNNEGLQVIDNKSREEIRDLVESFKQEISVTNLSAEQMLDLYKQLESYNSDAFHIAMMEKAVSNYSNEELSKEERDAAKRNYFDSRDNLFMNQVIRAYNKSALDGFRQQLKDAQNLSDAEFKEFFAIPENESVGDKKALIDNLIEQTESIEQTLSDVDMAFRGEKIAGIPAIFIDKQKQDSDLKDLYNKKQLLTNLLLTNKNTDARIDDIINSLKRKYNIVIDEEEEEFAQKTQDQLDELKKQEDDFVDKFFKGEFKSGKAEIDTKINEILKELRDNPDYNLNPKEGATLEEITKRNEALRKDLLKVALAFKQLAEMKSNAKEIKEAAQMLRDYQFLALRRAEINKTLNDLRGKDSKQTLDKFNYVEAYIEAKKREALITDLKTFDNYLENTSSSAIISGILKGLTKNKNLDTDFLFEEGEVFESSIYTLESEAVTLFDEEGNQTKVVDEEEFTKLRTKNITDRGNVQVLKDRIKQFEEQSKNLAESMKTTPKSKEVYKKAEEAKKEIDDKIKTDKNQLKEIQKDITEFELLEQAFKDGEVKNPDGTEKSLAKKNKVSKRFTHSKGDHRVLTNENDLNEKYQISMVNGEPHIVGKYNLLQKRYIPLTPKKINKIIDVQKVRAAKTYSKLNEALELADITDVNNKIKEAYAELKELNNALVKKQTSYTNRKDAKRYKEFLNTLKDRLNEVEQQIASLQSLKERYEEDILPFLADEKQIAKEIKEGLELNTPVIDKKIAEGKQGFVAVKKEIEDMIDKYGLEISKLNEVQDISLAFLEDLTTQLEQGNIDIEQLSKELSELNFDGDLTWEQLSESANSLNTLIEQVVKNPKIAKLALGLESTLNKDLKNVLREYLNISDANKEAQEAIDNERKVLASDKLFNDNSKSLVVVEDNLQEALKLEPDSDKRVFVTSLKAVRYRHRDNDNAITSIPSQQRFGKVMQMINEDELASYEFEAVPIQEGEFGYKLSGEVTSEDVINANIEMRLVKLTPQGRKYVQFEEGIGMQLSDEFDADKSIYSSFQTLAESGQDNKSYNISKFITVKDHQIIIDDITGLKKELASGFSKVEDLNEEAVRKVLQDTYNLRREALEAFKNGEQSLFDIEELSNGISEKGSTYKAADVIKNPVVQYAPVEKGKKLFTFVRDKYGNSAPLNNRRLNRAEAETIFELWNTYLENPSLTTYLVVGTKNNASAELTELTGNFITNSIDSIFIPSLKGKTLKGSEVKAAGFKHLEKIKSEKGKKFLKYLLAAKIKNDETYSFNDKGTLVLNPLEMKQEFASLELVNIADYVKSMMFQRSKTNSIKFSKGEITLKPEGGNEIKINAKNLSENKDLVIDFLTKKFHNIDLQKLNSSDPYFDIKLRGESTRITKYNNYQEYLIGKEGDSRNNEELPALIYYAPQDETKATSVSKYQKYPTLASKNQSVTKAAPVTKEVESVDLGEEDVDDTSSSKTVDTKSKNEGVNMITALTELAKEEAEKGISQDAIDLGFSKKTARVLFKINNNVSLTSEDISTLMSAVERGEVESSLLERVCKL